MFPISLTLPSTLMVADPEEDLLFEPLIEESVERPDEDLPIIFKQEAVQDHDQESLSAANVCDEQPVLEQEIQPPGEVVKIMQSIRRSALPLRVHQLWDGIQHSNSSNVMDFEKLVSVVSSLHKLPRDEINHELEKAIKDGLIVSEVETQRREETETYKLPDATDFDKGDHDWYCFQCHLGGNVVLCEDCPRVFHLECLPEERKPDKDLFVCPPCHIMSTKPSAEKLNVKQKALNVLLEYICARFKEWQVPLLEKADGKTWATAANRNAKEAWRMGLLVHMPMDMSTIVEKAKGAKYISLEEFQVDCETLVHAIAVYFGTDLLQGTGIGKSFFREASHDLQEIKLCHDCFRRSNEKDHAWWFCMACSVPHEVVWAKQAGYPYWPAKVMKKEGSKYDVRYFGGNYERGMIDAKNIQPIDTPLTALRIRRNANWNDAYDELQKFLDIAKNPEAANSLPPRGKPGSLNKSKGGKRAGANVVQEEVVTPKKARNVDSPKLKGAPRKTSGRASATTSSNNSSTATPSPQTNGGTPTQAKKNVAATKPPVSTPARRESTSKSNSTTAVPLTSPMPRAKSSAALDDSEVLDTDDMSFLNELEESDNLNGDAYFSDDEKSELTEKVSEDAVSSSCAESKSTRNAYTQDTNPFGIENIREKCLRYITLIKQQHAAEMSQNKKKQWCYNCEKEAIYHCCWNTAYCTIDCQQQHWGKEHKRLCRRIGRLGKDTPAET